jgi:hypothetical protein
VEDKRRGEKRGGAGGRDSRGGCNANMGMMVRSGAERRERKDEEKEMKLEAFRVGNRDKQIEKEGEDHALIQRKGLDRKHRLYYMKPLNK